MRIHYLQHVAFEDPGMILEWAKEQKYPVSGTMLFETAFKLPAHGDYDLLVIMGGPMNVDEDHLYPWLEQEKVYIKEAIEAGKRVLGICLGAQLIARALGAKVYKNKHKEIGWFPVSLTDQGKSNEIFRVLPPHFMPFHWHGDTFDLPSGCELMASSAACANQAFVYDNRVVALQFHLETAEANIRRLIDHCGDELVTAPFIQSASEMLRPSESLTQGKILMSKILCQLVFTAKEK